MTALTLALFAATAQTGAVPSRYVDAVVAVELPAEDGPSYGIPADMGVGDEVVVEGRRAAITRFRRRRVEGVRIPVAQLTLPDGTTVEARPLADMVTAQAPPPAAEGWFADDEADVLVIPKEVRAGSEVQVSSEALTVVAVARNLETHDVVVVEDEDGDRRALRVWWTW